MRSLTTSTAPEEFLGAYGRTITPKGFIMNFDTLGTLIREALALAHEAGIATGRFIYDHSTPVATLEAPKQAAEEARRAKVTAMWAAFYDLASVASVFEVEADLDDEENECEGHESLAGEHMGEAVFCDGSCVVKRCEADSARGTGTGMCDALLDSHGRCPRADRHIA